MTNARRSREKHVADERLIQERDSLLDVINALMSKFGVEHEGDRIALVEHEIALPTKRWVVDAIPTPEGTLIRQNRKLLAVGGQRTLILVPEGKV